MSDFAILTPRKPKFWEPCNGCGNCCHAQVCPTGVQFLDIEHDQPCPAVRWDGTKYRCGLITDPVAVLGLPLFAGREEHLNKHLSAIFEILIGSGQGCGMDDSISRFVE